MWSDGLLCCVLLNISDIYAALCKYYYAGPTVGLFLETEQNIVILF